MIKYSLILFLFFLQLSAFAQDNIIIGKVIDFLGKPVTDAVVCQAKSDNCASTDVNGLFHLLLNEKCIKKLIVSNGEDQTLEILRLDTIRGLITINLPETMYPKKYLIPKYYNNYLENKSDNYYTENKHKFALIPLLQIDFIFNDFNSFKPFLNDYNVDFMNKSIAIISFELAATYKNYYAGFNVGFSHNTDYKHDSLDIVFNSTQYGLHFGYNLLNTKRIFFTPEVAIKWNKYRLLNYNKEKDIPMAQYVAERDLNIRFNQLTGYAGFNLAYKMYNYKFLSIDYWTVGIYAGYAFKFTEQPWIYSKGNRLRSNEKIGMGNYNFGIQFSVNF
ncbi:MAG: hypothetical protein ACOYLE_03430 [Bacteroidales bacterium]